MRKNKLINGDTIHLVHPKVFEDLKKLTNDELNEMVRDCIFSDILTDIKASALGIELNRRGLPSPSLDLVQHIFDVICGHVANDEDLFNLHEEG